MTSGHGLGYAEEAYVASLAEFGVPLRLGRSGGRVLGRPIPATRHRDLVGPYPLFGCRDWMALADDVAAIGTEFVSVVLVADPLGGADPATLRTAFPHHLTVFKWHAVRDFAAPFALPPHHRRRLRRAQQSVEVEVCAEPLEHLDGWMGLYTHLTARHAVTGMSTFSREAFRQQLAMPDMTAVRAVRGGVTVGMALWLRAADDAYYHLGASSPAGYEVSASYAVFAAGLEHLRQQGVRRVDLGGAAGVTSREDGLSQFKRGWANDELPAYLCGRVLEPRAYAELSAAAGPVSGWFPAYRAPRPPVLVHG